MLCRHDEDAFRCALERLGAGWLAPGPPAPGEPALRTNQEAGGLWGAWHRLFPDGADSAIGSSSGAGHGHSSDLNSRLWCILERTRS